MNLILPSTLLLLLQCARILSQPAMQRIIINNHEWEVPDEPGWDEVIKDADSVQERLFSSCATVADCHRIIDEMRAVFFRHPVSKKYLDTQSDSSDDMFTSIFKWG
jgi:hypothetical protein